MKRVRVFLIDDHNLFRSGIKALLARQPDLEVVGEAADGLEGIERARQLKPDVVLLDLNMPGITGREAVQTLIEELPQTQVLMLTVSEDAEDLIDTLRAGARGYLVKNIDADFLVDAIRRAARGEAVMSSHMTDKLVQGLQRGGRKAALESVDPDRFSPREHEILALLARGESNKEIARKLRLAESTVKLHVQSILRKLNVTSRVQAAIYAVERGIVEKQ